MPHQENLRGLAQEAAAEATSAREYFREALRKLSTPPPVEPPVTASKAPKALQRNHTIETTTPLNELYSSACLQNFLRVD